MKKRHPYTALERLMMDFAAKAPERETGRRCEELYRGEKDPCRSAFSAEVFFQMLTLSIPILPQRFRSIQDFPPDHQTALRI